MQKQFKDIQAFQIRPLRACLGCGTNFYFLVQYEKACTDVDVAVS